MKKMFILDQMFVFFMFVIAIKYETDFWQTW